MSPAEERNLLLSQLIDGELPLEQANQVLAGVLDELSDVLGSSDAARQLSTMLQLRQALSPWRQQEPPRPIVTVAPEGRARHPAWHALSPAYLATWTSLAALLGGVLVAGGYFLHDRAGRPQPALAGAGQPAVIVTAQQRREDRGGLSSCTKRWPGR